MNCETCPFKDPDRFKPEQIKLVLAENYRRNHMGCRDLFPGWKPGLCHRPPHPVCAGYEVKAEDS